MKKFLNLDIFVGSTHVAWKRPVNISRHVTIAPQSRIRTAEVGNRLGFEAFQGLDVLLDVADHFTIGIAPKLIWSDLTVTR